MRNKEMLLIPGPTPVLDEIYDALASETRGHTDPRFVEVYRNALAQTKELFQTDGEVFVVRNACDGNGHCEYNRKRRKIISD